MNTDSGGVQSRWQAIGLAAIVPTATVLIVSIIVFWWSTMKPVVVTGLNTPRGLTPLDDGGLLIAEVRGGRLLHMSSRGDLTIIQGGLPATLGGPGGQYPTGISAAVLTEDAYYYVVGEHRGRPFSTLYRLVLGEDPLFFAGGVQLGGMPATHITNPYDLVSDHDGGFFVSDSGYNAVLHVTASGDIFDYMVFQDLPNPLYPESDIHPTVDIVPTGITYGPDGALYVASFTGHPHPSGLAYVYRVEDVNGDGNALDEGETTVFATGFSVATDLAFEADGALLVTEFSTDIASFGPNYDLEHSTAAPGRLLRWRNGAVQVVADGLVSPTAVAVVNGRIFVSEEFAGRVTEICAPEGMVAKRRSLSMLFQDC